MSDGKDARARKVINGYGDGGFRISGERVEGSVIVFPDHFLSWAPQRPEEVDVASLQPILVAERRVDILILGLASAQVAVHERLKAELRARGIAVDAMATGAACRTYNILLTESRAVAAALLAV